MLANVGSTELVVIVLVLIVIFGTSKITGLARNLGETSRDLKKVKKEYEEALAGKETDDKDDQVEQNEDDDEDGKKEV